MENLYQFILNAVIGGISLGGVLAGIKYAVDFGQKILTALAERKKARLEEARAHLSSSVEARRIENESDDAAWKRMAAMLEMSQKENERLEKIISQSQQISSLSGATIQRMFRRFYELGGELTRHETQIIKEQSHPFLLESFEEVKRKYDALGENMPGGNLQ